MILKQRRILKLLVPNSKPILYCTAYRPPSATVSWIELFTLQLEHASCYNNEIIITGDFNINLMKEPPKCWSNALEMFNLTQVVSCPTRVTENTSSLIDHVYTNMPENITEIKVPSLAMSDHFPVCITRGGKSSPKKNTHIAIEYRDYKQFNEVAFLSELANVDFSVLWNMTIPILPWKSFMIFLSQY